jgi:hypothetical protein
MESAAGVGAVRYVVTCLLEGWYIPLAWLKWACKSPFCNKISYSSPHLSQRSKQRKEHVNTLRRLLRDENVSARPVIGQLTPDAKYKPFVDEVGYLFLGEAERRFRLGKFRC